MATLRAALRRYLARAKKAQGAAVQKSSDLADGSRYDALSPCRLTDIRRHAPLTYLLETPVETALARAPGALATPPTPPPSPALDTVIAAWLAAKSGRSGSAKTRRAYADALASFRAQLRGAGQDLDGPADLIALAAQGWAGQGAPAPATYNQRLAILSSLYRFAQARGLIALANPITRVERRPVHAYADARALDAGDVRERLAALDRATPDGQRDYALLLLALTTGRRLAEVAALQWGDVEVRGNQVTIHVRRGKGGKKFSDTLARPVAEALLGYLQARHGPLRALAKDTPLWGVSARTLQRICEKHLGTGRFHALRHTFAHELEATGAKVSEIQAKLGHSSLATTGRYLAALSSAENPYAEDLAARFGL
jgi:integrase